MLGTVISTDSLSTKKKKEKEKYFYKKDNVNNDKVFFKVVVNFHSLCFCVGSIFSQILIDVS